MWTQTEILGQFLRWSCQTGLQFPRLRVFVGLTSCDAALSGEADGTHASFIPKKPIGMTAPETASDGSEACGHEERFHVRQQPPKQLRYLEPNIIGLLSE